MAEQDKEAEKQSWVVKEVKEHGVHDPYGDKIYLSVINKILGYAKGKKLKILDEGCGSSAYGIRFAKLGHSVVGVDISEAIVQSAKKRAKLNKADAIFRVGDIEKLPFPDSSFDMCLFGGVLHHFPSITKVMKEAVRVLKNGGYIVSIEPNRDNPHVFLSMEPKSPFRYKHLTINERSISHKEILNTLGDSAQDYLLFYELMTLTTSGRHATNSFFDKDIFYKLGGFAWKNVRGGPLNRIAAIIVYNLAHIYQKFAGKKRSGNFVILIVKIKK